MTAFTTTIAGQWAKAVSAQMAGNLRWLKSASAAYGVPVTSGPISVPRIDAGAPQAVTEGLAAAGDTVATDVALTGNMKKKVYSIPPSVADGPAISQVTIDEVIKNHASALLFEAQELVLTAIKTGTPALVETLPIGQMNFATDGTDAEIAQNLRLMGSVVGQCIANAQDLTPQDFAIIMDSKAWGNFTNLKSTAVQGPISSDGGFNWTYMGIPVYSMASGTSHFLGDASDYCAFITNRRNLAFAYNDPKARGPFVDNDEWTKIVTLLPFAYGVIEDDFMGAILNSAS